MAYIDTEKFVLTLARKLNDNSNPSSPYFILEATRTLVLDSKLHIDALILKSAFIKTHAWKSKTIKAERKNLNKLIISMAADSAVMGLGIISNSHDVLLINYLFFKEKQETVPFTFELMHESQAKYFVNIISPENQGTITFCNDFLSISNFIPLSQIIVNIMKNQTQKIGKAFLFMKFSFEFFQNEFELKHYLSIFKSFLSYSQIFGLGLVFKQNRLAISIYAEKDISESVLNRIFLMSKDALVILKYSSLISRRYLITEYESTFPSRYLNIIFEDDDYYEIQIDHKNLPSIISKIKKPIIKFNFSTLETRKILEPFFYNKNYEYQVTNQKSAKIILKAILELANSKKFEDDFYVEYKSSSLKIAISKKDQNYGNFFVSIPSSLSILLNSFLEDGTLFHLRILNSNWKKNPNILESQFLNEINQRKIFKKKNDEIYERKFILKKSDEAKMNEMIKSLNKLTTRDICDYLDYRIIPHSSQVEKVQRKRLQSIKRLLINNGELDLIDKKERAGTRQEGKKSNRKNRNTNDSHDNEDGEESNDNDSHDKNRIKRKFFEMEINDSLFDSWKVWNVGCYHLNSDGNSMTRISHELLVNPMETNLVEYIREQFLKIKDNVVIGIGSPELLSIQMQDSSFNSISLMHSSMSSISDSNLSLASHSSLFPNLKSVSFSDFETWLIKVSAQYDSSIWTMFKYLVSNQMIIIVIIKYHF